MKVVKSGEVVIGECGLPAGADSYGHDLFVGDIVTLYRVDGGVFPALGVSLTVIAQCDESGKPFVFGIKDSNYLQPKDLDCDHPEFDGDEDENPVGWMVVKVKDHSLCLVGENWKSFGFNYDEE